eukprot:scpid22605/ scgid15468/ Zinc-metallopeptidase, peroxisomal; Peroxisomal M16 protease
MDPRPLLCWFIAVIFSSNTGVGALRTYKYLKLHNGIRVLLVSDPHASKSAASLDVGVGSWSDPENIPGLAHFLEHMLFLGTKKYPVEGEYRRFLSKHAGIENAYTIYENTNFYFSASGKLDVFSEAFDRFAQFFIAPTLNAGAGQREMQAVDSEFRKRLNNDYLRFRQVLMTTANPEHPYHRFTTGTIDSLNITGIHQKLVTFHKTYYSANLMTLAVLGKESLNTLERLVQDTFSSVPNLKLKRPTFNTPAAFPVPEFTGIKVLMEPLSVVNTVYMYWPLPSLDSKQRERPIYYIAWLLGHEGRGSVLSELKSRQWATSVLAGPGLQTTSHWLMQVSLTLTDSGLANLDEVLSLVFQYIRLIEDRGVESWIYEEQQRLTLLNYLYQPKARPDLFVKTISRNMQVLSDPKDFRLPPTRNKFDPKLIRSILTLLTPQRLLLFVSSPHYWQQPKEPMPNPLNIAKPTLDQVEKWYKTKFRKDKLSAELVSKLQTAAVSATLGIPAKNPFVPGKLRVLDHPECTPIDSYSFMSLVVQKQLRRRETGNCRRSVGNCGECTFRYPERLLSNGGFSLWWKREMNFRTPKLYVDVLLGHPRLSGNVNEAASALLFRHLLLSYLNDKIYPAKLAGFSVQVTTSVAGVQFLFFGYSDDTAYKKFISTVFTGLVGYETHTMNATWFASSQRRTAEGVSGFGATAQVFKHVRTVYENRIMQKIFYDRQKLADAVGKLTPEGVRSHISKVLKHLFVSVLVYGNANQHEAQVYGKHVVQQLQAQGLQKLLPRKDTLYQQRLHLSPGSYVGFRVQGPNPSDVNSGVNVMYQIGPACGSGGDCEKEKHCQDKDIKNFILSRALAYYMKAACFEQLRTKEQLGYIVFCYPYESNGVASVHFIIQSAQYDPQFLLQRVEAFVSGFTKTLMNKISSRVQWHHGIRLGTAVAISNGRNMKFRSKMYWRKIVEGSCKFDRRQLAFRAMHELLHNPRRMLDFYEKFFLSRSSRRLLAVQLYGKGKPVSTVAAPGQTVVTEDTVEAFKSQSSFYAPGTN